MKGIVVADLVLDIMNGLYKPWVMFQPYDPVAKTERSRKVMAFLAFVHLSFLYLQTPYQESM